MAQEIEFLARFKAAQQDLSKIKKDLIEAVGKKIKLDVETSIKTKGGGIALSGEGGAKNASKLRAKVEKIQAKLIASELKMDAAISKRTSNLNKIAQLEDKKATATKDDIAALRAARASKGGLTSQMKRTTVAFAALEIDLAIAKAEFRAIASASNLVHSGLSALTSEGIVKLDTKNLQAGLDLLSSEAKKVTTDVFIPLITSGLANGATSLRQSLDVLASNITSRKADFEKLGFNVDDFGKILRLGAIEFRSELQKAGLKVSDVAQSSDGPIVGQAPGRPEALGNIKDQARLAAAQTGVEQEKLKFSEIQLKLQEDINNRQKERQQILGAQKGAQAKILDLVGKSQSAETELAATQQGIRESLRNREYIENSIVDAEKRQRKVAYDIGEELEKAKTNYRNQNIRLEEIQRVGQGIIVVERAKLEASTRAKELLEREVRQIEERLENPGGVTTVGVEPQLPTEGADATNEFNKQAVEALKRFRNGLQYIQVVTQNGNT